MKQIESFFWGIIAALGAMSIELVLFLGYSFFTDPLGNFSVEKYYSLPLIMLAIAAVEEIFKFMVIAKRIEFLSFERSFVVNASFVGAGFAAAELFFIQWYGFFDGSHARNLTEIALLHVATAAFIGYRVAIRNHKKVSIAFITIGGATLMHFIYNFLETFQGERFPIATMAYVAILLCASIFNLFRVKSKLAA